MKSPFMLCLQTCPLDLAEAEDLVDLICALEPRQRGSVEFVLAIRRDVDMERAKAIQRQAATKFFRSQILVSRRYGTGHPAGCNDLWQDSMMQIFEQKKYGHTKATGVFMFEPDCCPLREDWIDILRVEWERAQLYQKEVIGSVCQPGQTFEHINGNAIFSTELIRNHPEVTSSTGNWDIVHRKLFLRIGFHTDAIEQLYRHKDTLSDKFIQELREKWRKPVILHGVRNGSARTAIRKLIESGKIREPIVPRVPETGVKEGEIKFSISILAMDNLALTEKCVDSVIQNSTQPFELLLWDNGSKEEVFEYFRMLQQNIANITVTRVEKNVGFIPPNLAHAEVAKGRYFICLNNDATVPPFWLEKLEQPFLDHESAAISGPEGTCNQLNEHFHGHPGRLTEYIEGSCLCVRMDLVKEFGLFSDTCEFAYGEDCDLSLRMREKGYTIHQVPFTITHHRGATSKNIEGIKEIQQKNHDSLQKRWGHYLKTRRMDFPILFRRTGAVGDVLLTTPVIRAMKKQRPLSHIYVVTGTPEIFNNNPHVRQASNSMEDIWFPDQMMIDLDMAYENMPNTNIVEAYHKIAGTKSDGDDSEEIFPNQEDINFAKQAIGDKRFVAVHCGKTTWKGKNWPEKRWADIINWLRNEQKVKVILVGNGEMPKVNPDATVMNMTTIHQLAAILDHCELFIGHDSFPFHCAMAVKTKALALFGVSSSHIVIPKGSTGFGIDSTRPLAGSRHKVSGTTFADTSEDDNPMLDIGVDQVVAKIHEIQSL